MQEEKDGSRRNDPFVKSFLAEDHALNAANKEALEIFKKFDELPYSIPESSQYGMSGIS